MEIRVPQLAEGADTGTVVNILVSEGDRIRKGQTILELENQKAVAPIPSPQAGAVSRIHVKVGDPVSVGQVLITLSEGEGEALRRAGPERRSSFDYAQDERSRRAQDERRGQLAPVSASGAPPPASPSIRKMAAQLGIDLTRVKGSEPGGRITVKDLQDYLKEIQKGAPPPHRRIDFAQWGPVTRKPLTSLRKAIASGVTDSWRTIPHVTLFDEINIARILELKERYTPGYQAQGVSLTITGFFLKGVVSVLKIYPIFNSSLDEETEEIILKGYHHIGVAVDTKAGLIVPVLKDVDKKSLLVLSRELDQLAQRTRERKISLEELQGGTFTISNQGGIGGGHFTPIIRKPEVAILGVGRGKENRAPVSLSYDHRVIDGADAARFMVALAKALESFPEEQVRI